MLTETDDVLDRLFHPQGIDFVHIDTVADRVDQGQRKLARPDAGGILPTRETDRPWLQVPDR
jgi:hypothetical protein